MEDTQALRIRRETHRKLVACAEADLRTLQGEMEYIITQYYEQHVKQHVTNGSKA